MRMETNQNNVKKKRRTLNQTSRKKLHTITFVEILTMKDGLILIKQTLDGGLTTSHGFARATFHSHLIHDFACTHVCMCVCQFIQI